MANPKVPSWEDLPAYAQKDLEPRGYDQEWFVTSTDPIRLTVLNLYVKLHGMNLWEFVCKDAGTGKSSNAGELVFHCTDAQKLKDTLKARNDFNDPDADAGRWSSREERTVGQLHFKHFEGWPVDLVQAHIDRVGLFHRHPVLVGVFTLGIGSAVQAIRHRIDDHEHGWQQVYEIRKILLDQGWDPVPLLGKNEHGDKGPR